MDRVTSGEEVKRILEQSGFALTRSRYDFRRRASALNGYVTLVALARNRRISGPHDFALFPAAKLLEWTDPNTEGSGIVLLAR